MQSVGMFASWCFLPTSGKSDHLTWGNNHKCEVVFTNITCWDNNKKSCCKNKLSICRGSSPIFCTAFHFPSGHRNGNDSLGLILLFLEDPDFSLPQTLRTDEKPKDHCALYSFMRHTLIDTIQCMGPDAAVIKKNRWNFCPPGSTL